MVLLATGGIKSAETPLRSLTNLVFTSPAVLASSVDDFTKTHFNLVMAFEKERHDGNRPWGGHLEQLSEPKQGVQGVVFTACWQSELQLKTGASRYCSSAASQD